MKVTDYRVVRRTEPDLRGAWGLWSDERKRWLDVVYATEREATDMLNHLHAAGSRKRRE